MTVGEIYSSNRLSTVCKLEAEIKQLQQVNKYEQTVKEQINNSLGDMEFNMENITPSGPMKDALE